MPLYQTEDLPFVLHGDKAMSPVNWNCNPKEPRMFPTSDALAFIMSIRAIT